jgi:hypothetical protein
MSMAWVSSAWGPCIHDANHQKEAPRYASHNSHGHGYGRMRGDARTVCERYRVAAALVYDRTLRSENNEYHYVYETKSPRSRRRQTRSRQSPGRSLRICAMRPAHTPHGRGTGRRTPSDADLLWIPSPVSVLRLPLGLAGCILWRNGSQLMCSVLVSAQVLSVTLAGCGCGDVVVANPARVQQSAQSQYLGISTLKPGL